MNSYERQHVIEQIETAKGRWAKSSGLQAIRADFDDFLNPSGVRASEQTVLNEIEVSLFGDLEAPATILYCHGGGFQIGSSQSHGDLAYRLGQSCGALVALPKYGLAPENRAPVAHLDVFEAYRQILTNSRFDGPLVVAGDSAGGSLALGILAQALEAHVRLPDALMLISPWLDLRLTGESYRSRRDVDIFSEPDQLRLMARTYVGKEGDWSFPLLNPLAGDWADLPPTIVHVGDHDITRDDGIRFADRARSQGAEVELKVWPEMFHHFQAFPELPEAGDSLAEIGAFVRRAIG